MTNDKAISNDAVGASFIANNSLASGMKAGGVYTVQCFDKDGNLKWEDQSHNLVVIVAGAFLASVSSGTSGVLFSESDFQSPGDRTVVSGDTLNVTYTFSLDAA